MLHFWEEPPISGSRGSGAVFFSGCNLGCLYCQNDALSNKHAGIPVDETQLAHTFLDLQEKGAHNINLVTGTHFLPIIYPAVKRARAHGLFLPIVWNSSGYETHETLLALEDIVDVWLLDLKYQDPEVAQELSGAKDFPYVAEAALLEIATHVYIKGGNVVNEDDVLSQGLIVRHLVLPGYIEDTKRVLQCIAKNVGDSAWVSLMSQYTPNSWASTQRTFPSLQRTLSQKEYQQALDCAKKYQFEVLFTQDATSQSSQFTPFFNGSGFAR